jgi:ElaB/YqjD/DUF883 family membrane-anchored ribosome-binding protein
MNEFPASNSPFDAPPPASDPFSSAKQSAIKAADDLRAAAAAKAAEIRQAAEARAAQFKDVAGEKVEQFKDVADQTLQDAKVKLKSFTENAEKFAREKPLQALAVAFGAGLLAGLVLRR